MKCTGVRSNEWQASRFRSCSASHHLASGPNLPGCSIAAITCSNELLGQDGMEACRAGFHPLCFRRVGMPVMNEAVCATCCSIPMQLHLHVAYASILCEHCFGTLVLVVAVLQLSSTPATFSSCACMQADVVLPGVKRMHVCMQASIRGRYKDTLTCQA